MKKIHVVALVLPLLLNACAPKKSTGSEAATTELNTDGVEYCAADSSDATATCFIEMKTGAKSEFITTKESYDALLLSDSFANQNVNFQQIEDKEYMEHIVDGVIPTVTLKNENLKLYLASVSADDSANAGFKLPGRIGTGGSTGSGFGGLGRISSSIFSAGKSDKMKKFVRSFTKGFTSGGKISVKRVAGGIVTMLGGIFGLVGFTSWIKEKTGGKEGTNSKSRLTRDQVADLEIDIILPADYVAE